MALPLYHIQHVFISLIYHAAQLLRLCLTLCMNCSLPGSSSMGFPRQEYWSGLPWEPWHLSPKIHEIFPPRTEHISCISCIIGGFFAHWVTWEAMLYYTQNHAFKLKYYYNILKHLNVTEKLQEKYEELQYCILEKN